MSIEAPSSPPPPTEFGPPPQPGEPAILGSITPDLHSPQLPETVLPKPPEAYDSVNRVDTSAASRPETQINPSVAPVESAVPPRTEAGDTTPKAEMSDLEKAKLIEQMEKSLPQSGWAGISQYLSERPNPESYRTAVENIAATIADRERNAFGEDGKDAPTLYKGYTAALKMHLQGRVSNTDDWSYLRALMAMGLKEASDRNSTVATSQETPTANPGFQQAA